MSIFKIEPRSSQGVQKLIQKINYIRDPISTSQELCICEYISSRYPFEEMMAVKFCHASQNNDTLRGEQFFDFVLSLNEEESVFLSRFISCMKGIQKFLAHYGGGHYQSIGYVHTDTDNLHAHVIENNIDFKTGHRFNIHLSDFYKIHDTIDSILTSNGFSGLLPIHRPGYNRPA